MEHNNSSHQHHQPSSPTVERTNKEALLHRIRILEGHLKCIESMLEKDAYCVDIIHQSMAVQKALKRLDMVIMKNHLRTCVVDQIKDNQVDKSVTELMQLYEMK